MSETERPVWVPCDKNLFTKAYVLSEENGRVQVRVEKTNEVKEVESQKVERVNPTQFDFARDMADLTYLNEPSVVNNLYMRWSVGKIYTYSGLFLVAVNPYKDLPIYDFETMKKYRLNKKDDLPPHIYAVSEQAYKSLVETGKDQSVLVTGESGAGKTENTKKVIQYLSHITAGSNCRMDERIWQTNPILESFGNAQTIRNANSSRFGKFVKIQFDPYTKDIIGASIQWYLLEKSRVIQRHENERNYHIFYQLLAGASAELKQQLFLNNQVSATDFNILKGTATIDGVDDAKLYANLIEAFEIMGFSDQLVKNIVQLVAAVLWLGQIEYKKSSVDQGDLVSELPLKQACELLNVDFADLKDAILRPKVKAGKELMHQSRNASQAQDTTNALAKALYEKLFGFIVAEINDLISAKVANVACIGVLDIAGFEIFDQNSFEQLCINYTNEKLQQFFNHHMFVLEQEEYVKEKVDWEYKDYGSDLQPTIELIEQQNQPMGILSILDEESVLPNGSDAGFHEKLVKNWSDNSKFKHKKIGLGFTVDHYAQSVEYTTEGWLEKNKDPLNDAVVQTLLSSKSELVRKLFHQQFFTSKPKNSMLRTVAQRHKQQLNDLMNHLAQTEPHFVRCIIPNQHRSPSEFDNALVLDQLRYNGVLEGIRIARSGFPNRLDFSEFKHRYGPLVGDLNKLTDVQASAVILERLGLQPEQYKVGLSKVFFRNGVLAKLERQLEDMIDAKTIIIQSLIRGSLARKALNHEKYKRFAAKTIATCFKSSIKLDQDPWWLLSHGLKQMVTSKSGSGERRRDMHLTKLETNIQTMKDEQYKLLASKNQLRAELIEALKANEETMALLETQKAEYEDALKLATKRDEASKQALKELMERQNSMRTVRTTLESELNKLKDRLEENAKETRAAVEAKESDEKVIAELTGTVSTLKTQLDHANNELAAINSEKQALESRLTKELQTESATWKAKYEESTRSLAEINTKVENSEQALVEMRAQYDDSMRSLEEMTAKYAETVESFKEMKSKHDTASQILAETEAKLTETVESLQTMEEKYKNSIHSLDSVEMKYTESVRELEATKAKYDEKVALLSDSETKNKTLKTQFTATNLELAELKIVGDKYKQLHQETAELKAQVDDLHAVEAELNKTVAQLEETSSENSALEIKLEETNAELKLETEKAAKLELESKEWKNKHELASKERDTDKAQWEITAKDLEIAAKELNAVKHELSESKTHLKESQSSADKCVELQKQVKQLQTDLKQRTQSADEVQHELQTATQKLEEAQRAIETHTKKETHLKELMRNAEEYKLLKANTEDFTQTITAKDKQIKLLQEKLNKQESERSASSSNLILESSKLKKTLELMNSTNIKLKDELQTMKFDYNNLKSDFVSQKSELRNHLNTIKKLQTDMKETREVKPQFEIPDQVRKDKIMLETDLRNAVKRISSLESSLQQEKNKTDPLAIASLQKSISKQAALIHEWEIKFESLPKNMKEFYSLKESYEKQRREKNQLVQEASLMLLKVKRNADELERQKLENQRLKQEALAAKSTDTVSMSSKHVEMNPKYVERLNNLADLEFKKKVHQRNLLKSRTSSSEEDERALKIISNDRRVSDKQYDETVALSKERDLLKLELQRLQREQENYEQMTERFNLELEQLKSENMAMMMQLRQADIQSARPAPKKDFVFL